MPDFFLDEQVLSLDKARELIPGRDGQRVGFTTVWRWVTFGVLDPKGRRVKLEARRLGGRWLTSKEAIERFTIALTP